MTKSTEAEREFEQEYEEEEESCGDAEREAMDPEPSSEEAVAAAAQEEIAALRDRMMRLAADFDNYRKRAIREQQEARDFSAMNVLRDFLPVLDNLERALAHCSEDDHPVLQGVKLVAKQFTDTLGRHGVEAVAAVGVPFDPEVHEAVAQQPTAEREPGTIIDEAQRGYTMRGRLLRASKVVVASPPPAATAEESSD